MPKRTYRWRLIISMLCVLFIATACFRAGIDEAQPNAVSERITDVPTLTPSNTVAPTDTPTEEADATDELIFDRPTDTDTPTPTVTDTPEAPAATDTEVFVAQDLQPDTFQQTATELVRTATQGAAIPLTQTALFLQAPTVTNTLSPTPTQFQIVEPTQDFDAQGGVNLIGNDCVHEVRRGDNLFRISIYYGVPINVLATYSTNNITNPNLIRIGQRIIIPDCGTTPGLPPPTSTPGPFVTPITGGCPRPYTVQQGDTLFSISLRCGVSVLDLQYANRIINPNYIVIGRVLTIP